MEPHAHSTINNSFMQIHHKPAACPMSEICQQVCHNPTMEHALVPSGQKRLSFIGLTYNKEAMDKSVRE